MLVSKLVGLEQLIAADTLRVLRAGVVNDVFSIEWRLVKFEHVALTRDDNWNRQANERSV